VVGQEHGGAAHPEDAVGHEHRPGVADVRAGRHDLQAHDQSVGVPLHLQRQAIRKKQTPIVVQFQALARSRERIINHHWVNLKQLLGEVDGDEASAAAHAGEVIAGNVPAELVVVDDHGRERRCGAEEAAVDDDDPDVAGADASLGKQLVDGAEHDSLRLAAGLCHARVGRRAGQGLGQVGSLPQSRPLQDLALESKAVVGEGPVPDDKPHERLPGHRVLRPGLVARQV